MKTRIELEKIFGTGTIIYSVGLGDPPQRASLVKEETLDGQRKETNARHRKGAAQGRRADVGSSFVLFLG